MSINDAINRLKTESKSILEAKELKERAAAVTEDSPVLDPDMTNNPKLKKICIAFNKMDTAFWEDFLKKQNDGLDECAEENREEYIERCVYEYYRMEAIYNGYKLIIEEPHRMDEHLKGLKERLRKMEEGYGRGKQSLIITSNA